MDLQDKFVSAGTDFSVIGLIQQADLVVQSVMVVLLFASVISWGIILHKFFVFKRELFHIRSFERKFWECKSLRDLYYNIGNSPRSCIESIFYVGMHEWNKSFDERGENGIVSSFFREHFERAMKVSIDKHEMRLLSSMDFLATVGAVTPFIGLFGTVWGVKSSFQGIATSQSANLAVVAPGIAEALIATAFGLFVAIPAVVAYNMLNRSADRITGGMSIFAEEFYLLLSRQAEKKKP